MTYQWLIDKLKTDGQGTKKEVLSCLKEATIEDIRKLVLDTMRISFLMNVLGVEDYQEYLKSIDKRGTTNGN